jgi:hypothetical protein
MRRQPAQNSLCLCGSGHKFKRCCGKLGPLTSDHWDSFRELWDKDRAAAIIHLRAYLAWYRNAHTINTVPLLRAAKTDDSLTTLATELLETDIAALGEILKRLVNALNFARDTESVDRLIISFERAIDAPAWKDEIDEAAVLAALGPDWNEARARAVLKKRVNPTISRNFDLLCLYFGICHKELGALQSSRIADRIAALAERDVDRLHYELISAVQVISLGEDRDGVQAMLSAIERFKVATSQRDLDFEEQDWLSKALCTVATFMRDEAVFDEARARTEILLRDTNLPSEARGEIEGRLACLYKDERQFHKGAVKYLSAFELDGNQTHLLLLRNAI